MLEHLIVECKVIFLKDNSKIVLSTARMNKVKDVCHENPSNREAVLLKLFILPQNLFLVFVSERHCFEFISKLH